MAGLFQFRPRTYRVYMVTLLLLAAVLRIYGINNLSPPGLEHDEVAHWLINQDILDGNHAIYFTDAYGHEAGYHYYQTAFMSMLGDNAFSLRLPSVFAGLLGLAVTFTLLRRLFGLKAALFSTALLAVLFWPIFYGRLGLRAISLPLLSGLSAYFWWRGWQLKAGIGQNRIKYWHYFALAGLFAGLSLHTYLASRVVPIFYGLFAIYLLLTQRPTFSRRWRGIVLFFVTYTLVTLPLILYLMNNPTAEFRISEVDAPLRALQEGNLRPVLENSLKILGMFGVSGDPLWRQNVAGLTVFDPLTAVAFYFGAGIALSRWRNPRYFFLLLWLATAAIPSIVTIDAPSSIRIINALPVLTVFPYLALRFIHSSGKLSTVSAKLSTIGWGKLVVLLGIVMVFWNVGRTSWNLFEIWPEAEEVQFVWQADFMEIARYLDRSNSSGPVAIGGWTPETMDAPSMELLLKRDDLKISYFDPTQSIVLPPAGVEVLGRVAHPTILPLAPEIEQTLNSWGWVPDKSEGFNAYIYIEWGNPPLFHQPVLTFNDELYFLGYELVSHQPLLTPGNNRLLTYWRVKEPPNEPRRFFLHLVDEQGQPIVQQDTLGAPAEYWHKGDVIIQLHSLEIPPNDRPTALLLGVYNPTTNQRLTTEDGSDSIQLGAP